MNIYSKGIIVASLACGLSITTAATYANPQQFQSPSITHQQTSDQGQRVEPGSVPVGLSSSDWASIQEQITDGKYRAYRHDDTGFVSANPAHGWNIRYLEDGTTSLTPRDSDANAYRLGLRLNAVGYAQPETLNHPQLISAEGTTLTYQWNDNLREFWINTQNDLEQWFVLEQRPAGADDGQALTLQMNLDSDLDATQTGNSIRFVNQSGTIISYNKLKAWDASGRDLLAHMQLADNQLSLVIDDSQASYPITIDPSFQQQAYLKASNTNAGDAFGVAVAISGDTLVVGADFENSKATGVNGNQSDNTAGAAGAVYVFTRNGTTWSQQAYLKASNTNAGDAFGVAVAISGDTLVVGADFEDSKTTGVNGNQSDNTASGAGAAYVFTRSGTTWSQQAYLKASNTETADSFGSAVAISGDTVVIGAFLENGAATGVNGVQNNDGAFRSGAAYVFTRSGTAWSQQAYLKSSNNDVASGDWFGYSVAISNATIVVGARSERSSATGVNGDQSDNSAINAGAAYVFTRSGTAWSQQAYLKASNTDAGDLFGESVTISGDTVVIGATGEDSYTTGVNGDQARDTWPGSTGASYVFTRSGTTWSQQAYLKASNTGTNDVFGKSVAISGDTVVVGAPHESGDAGAAYVFTRSGTAWSQQAFLKASNTQPTDEFGLAVAIAGDTVVVGAPLEDSSATGINGDQFDNLAGNAGAAYVFKLDLNTGGSTYTIGGNVSGLSGTGLVLRNNGSNPLSISADGGFTFSTPLDDGSAYAVTISSQPNGLNEVCSVSNGSGTLNGANVSNVSVTCVSDTATYTIGGNVSGLSGTGLVLRNNGGNPLSISADGGFTFSTPLDDGSAYAVTVSSQPDGLNEVCSVSNGSGTLNGANVSNVSVTCVSDTATYTIGGNVSGLSGTGLVLRNNGSNPLSISADGGFTFSTPLDDGSAYAVTVSSQPDGLNEVCSVSNGSGTLNGANVSNVSVTCVSDTATYTIGGNVSGLSGTGLVLRNNGGNPLSISADGGFTFSTPLDDGSAYAVTVSSQPDGLNEVCSVSNGSGTLNGANVSNVSVTCVSDTATYTIGGNVSGLSGTGLVLRNNGGNPLSISADGGFTFSTPLDDGSAYAVTVSSQPDGLNEVCSVSNGSGTLNGANVSNVSVTCVSDTATYTIGGNVSGLSGTGLVLRNNGGNPLSINADGGFTFSTPLDDGSAYAVTVSSQPDGLNEVCSVSNGSGTLNGANVSNVSVTCVSDTATYTIGGNVSGLSGTGLVLRNNGGNPLSISADGGFTFSTPLDDGSAYAVTISSQPDGLNEVCSVSNGSGTLNGANVSNVSVTCVSDDQVIIISTGFETGNASDWSLDGAISVNDTEAIDRFSLRHRKSGTSVLNVSTVGYSGVSVTMHLAGTSLEQGDDCFAEVSTNGGDNWTSVIEVHDGNDDGTFNAGTLSPQGADNNSSLKLRFRSTGQHKSDYCWGDDVTVMGTPMSSNDSFTVYKDFSDDNTESVSVSLSCSSGTVTNSPQFASEATPAEFSIEGAAAGTSCTAIETSVPAEYTSDESDCQDGDPLNGFCTIVNNLDTPLSEAMIVDVGFEDEDGDGFGDAVGWELSGSVAIDGILAIDQFSLRHGIDSTSELSVSTAGYTDISVTMHLAATALKQNGGCYAEVSTNGGSSWTTVVEVLKGNDDGTFVANTVSPGGADDNVDLQLRFRAAGKGSGGYCYGDDAIILGTPSGAN